MLFLLTITVSFSIWHWKRVFWAATGFTVGHSLSLAAATLGLVKVNGAWVEFIIPVTILISALFTAIKSQGKKMEYFSALQFTTVILFGLIHGLGFSSELLSFLSGEIDPLIPLVSFNIGVELGQLLIVAVILLFNYLVENILNIKKANWVLFCSGGAFSIALMLIFENKIW